MAQPQLVEAPFISERLTWDDILERYRYEWVCLVEIDQIDDGFEVHSGRVVGHGKTRQEALDQARPYHTQFHTPDAEIAPYFSRPFTPPKRQVPYEWDHPEPVGPPFISEPLTWEQICDRYPNEWVCLVEFDKINDTDFEFGTARVVGHGKTRRAPLEQAQPFYELYRSMAHYFTWRDSGGPSLRHAATGAMPSSVVCQGPRSGANSSGVRMKKPSPSIASAAG